MDSEIEKISNIHRILMSHAYQACYLKDINCKGELEYAFDRASNIKINFSKIPEKQCSLLFPLWESNSKMRLIPVWLYDNFELGQTIISITGKLKIVRVDYQNTESPNYIDDDQRQGYLGWGFIPKE